MATKKQKIFYQLGTKNDSFLKMYKILKSLGIKRNKFHLKLYDPKLNGVDPHDPNLSLEMKNRVTNEVRRNFFYFIREVVRIPVSGGSKPYELHRGNLALSWCLLNNFNVLQILPRQNGKTIGTAVFYLWLYNFATINSEIMLMNKSYGDAKNNLKRIKDLREELPEYLQILDRNDINNLTSLTSVTNNNTVVAKPTANDEASADNLGRGCTQAVQYYDEFAFLKYNSIIYKSATPANSQASLEAKKNKRPYHRLITTTPGDVKTEHGRYCKDFINRAAVFTEHMYDWSRQDCEEFIAVNSKNNFLFIEFSYKQLGRDEEWFQQQCRDLDMDTFKIKREILLEWNKASDSSVFSEDQLELIDKHKKEPYATVMINKFFALRLYKDFDWRQPVIIGIDIANGLNRDNTAITIADARTLEVLGDLKNPTIGPVETDEIVSEICQLFPNGPIIPERNGPGITLITLLLKRAHIKKRLYYEIKKTEGQQKVSKGLAASSTREKVETRVYGIDTTKTTRDLMIDLLYNIVNEDYAILNSPDLIDDISGLERNRLGKIEHSPLTHDDNLFSYLMIRYVWVYGKNLSKFNITKRVKRTDADHLDGQSVEVVINDGNKKKRIYSQFSKINSEAPVAPATQIVTDHMERLSRQQMVNELSGIYDKKLDYEAEQQLKKVRGIKAIFGMNKR